MEGLKNFGWHLDIAGYRLAWMPERGCKAFWVKNSEKQWSDTYLVDRRRSLKITRTDYADEKRISQTGIYTIGQRQKVNKKSDKSDIWTHQCIYPFQSDRILSLNLHRNAKTLDDYLNFTNRFGFIGHGAPLDRLHAVGRDPTLFTAAAEHESGWHHLRNVLFRIYEYYPAIRDRDKSFLDNFIYWESNDIVREKLGPKIGDAQILPAIAMRGLKNTEYFGIMKKDDLFMPAAIALIDIVNRYLEKALSLEILFNSSDLRFGSSLRFGSLGAALVAEAVEFVVGRLEARSCKVCGTWFRVDENNRRKDRIFCSAACKMRDYRTRKFSIPQS